MNEESVTAEGEEFEQELGLDTIFRLPPSLTEHPILGRHLVIAPEQANWLVCDDEEYAAFSLFRARKSIMETEGVLMEQHKMNADQARAVVSRLIAQILGKEFLQEAEIREKPTFKVASLHITEGCNLRCTTCLWSSAVAGPDECSLDQWKRFLEAFRDFGSHTVTLTGGEPMTNPDCFEIMLHAREVGLKVVMLSNGTLITKENARLIGEYCNEVQVSIDGPSAEIHDSVRGKGTFEKTLLALRELSAYPQCHLSVAMTPTLLTLPSFQTDLHRFVNRIWKEINPEINFRVAQKLVKGRSLPTMSEQGAREFKKAVIALCDDQLEMDFVHKLDAASIIPNRRIFGCGLADIFSVRANGDVKLCAYSPDPVGNIKDIRDDKAFLPDLAKKLGQLIRSTRVEKVRPCGECDLRYFCGGKCRKDNLADYGNPLVCECDWTWKNEWYERLVRINPYVVEPITGS